MKHDASAGGRIVRVWSLFTRVAVGHLSLAPVRAAATAAC